MHPCWYFSNLIKLRSSTSMVASSYLDEFVTKRCKHVTLNKMVNGSRYQRWKASAQRQLCLPLLPFNHVRSESINADSLNLNFLQLGRRSGGWSQRSVHPMRLPVNTVIHTTLVDLEPATFRSLVDRWSDALPVAPLTSVFYSMKFNKHFKIVQQPELKL